MFYVETEVLRLQKNHPFSVIFVNGEVGIFEVGILLQNQKLHDFNLVYIISLCLYQKLGTKFSVLLCVKPSRTSNSELLMYTTGGLLKF